MAHLQSRTSLGAVVALVGSLTLGSGVVSASPPGVNGRIAFTSSTNGPNDLFEMDQTQPGYPAFQALPTNSPRNDQNAQWSPNGMQLAFASDRDGDFEIYIWDSQTNETRQVTDNRVEDEGPGWSPTGTQLAFSRAIKNKRDVFVRDLGTGIERNLTNNRANDYGRNWYGDELVFTSDRDGDYEIYKINAVSGGPAEQLTHNRIGDYGADWAPNGTEILFVRDPGTRTERAYGDSEIWRMSSSGEPETLLVDQSGVDKQATWSPDGTRICWASTTEASGGDYELFEMDLLLGGTIRQLTNDSANQYTPDYRPILQPA